jgi:hypothetical protein
MLRAARFDAPFWAALLLGVFAVGSLGFFGLAVAAEDLSHAKLRVLEHDDSVY